MLLKVSDLLGSARGEDAASATAEADLPPPIAAMEIDGRVDLLLGKRGVDLDVLLPRLDPDTSYHIPTVGHWSLHEMLGHLLRRTGPARVWMTSWGISTKPLQYVLDLVRSGSITELDLLLDPRVKLQCPQAYQLLIALSNEARVRVKLAKNHSKLTLIRSATHTITLPASANLTRNPRIEYYVVCTHRSLLEENLVWLEETMNGAQPFAA